MEDKEILKSVTHQLSCLVSSLPKLETNTLNETQIEILSVIKRAKEANEVLTIGDILNKLKLRDKSLTLNIVSQATKKLSKSGLVKKSHSTNDDRKVEVRITAKGMTAIQSVYNLWHLHLNKLIIRLDEAENNIFVGLLKKITSGI